MRLTSSSLPILLAMRLAGHIGSNLDEVRTMREELLANHVKLVRDLIPVNEQMIFDQFARRRSS